MIHGCFNNCNVSCDARQHSHAPFPDCNWGRRVTAPRVPLLQWPRAEGSLIEDAPETVAPGPGLARPWHGSLRGADLRPSNPAQLAAPHLCHQASQRLTRGQPRLFNYSTTSVRELRKPVSVPLSLLRDLWWNECQPEETGAHQHFIPGRYINAVMTSSKREKKNLCPPWVR